MSSTKPFKVAQLCPKCHRQLYQCWIVGGGKPRRLAPDLWCGYCELDFPKAQPPRSGDGQEDSHD